MEETSIKEVCGENGWPCCRAMLSCYCYLFSSVLVLPFCHLGGSYRECFDILLQAFLGQTSLTSLAMILQIPALLVVATLCDGLYHRGTIYMPCAVLRLRPYFNWLREASGSGLGALIVGLWCAGIFDVGLVHAYRHPLIQLNCCVNFFGWSLLCWCQETTGSRCLAVYWAVCGLLSVLVLAAFKEICAVMLDCYCCFVNDYQYLDGLYRE